MFWSWKDCKLVFGKRVFGGIGFWFSECWCWLYGSDVRRVDCSLEDGVLQMEQNPIVVVELRLICMFTPVGI